MTPPYVYRRSFYPASLEPLAAERAALKARKRSLTPEQQMAQKRMAAYAKIRKPVRNSGTKMVGAGLAVLGAVGLAGLMGGPATNAWFFGLKDSTGSYLLIPGAFAKSAFLAVQGAASVAWVVQIQSRQRERMDDLERLRFQEWTRSVTVKDMDLIPAILPSYAEPNPYDPTEDEFAFVIGEHHGTEGHKFSNEAFWYCVPFEGLVTGGTVVFGISGSGKTAAVIKPFMRQVFGWKATTDYDTTGRGMEKCAGLVLDPKGSLSGDLRDVLRWSGIDPVLERGRTEDPKMVTLTPLLYGAHVEAGALARLAAFEGKPAIRVQRRIMELVGRVASGKDRVSRSLRMWAEKQGKVLDRSRHQAGLGAFRVKGRTLYRTERHPRPKRFLGRENDYIELGYDDYRINRIISAHDRIQAAAQAMSKAGYLDRDGMAVQLPSAAVALSREMWVPRESSYLKASIHRALLEMLGETERLMATVFMASDMHQTAMRTKITLGKPSLSVLQGVPGTNVGDADDMEAYADLRQLVRYLATAKERPGEDVARYRARWLSREATALTFGNSLDAVLEKLHTAIRKAEWLGAGHPEIRTLAGELDQVVRFFRQSMLEAMGPAGLESGMEFGQGKVEPSELLTQNLRRCESYLQPQALADFKSGTLNAFRCYESTRPSPRPRGEEERTAMGYAYAAPDPFAQGVEEASELHTEEKKLAGELKAWIQRVVRGQQAMVGLLRAQAHKVTEDIEIRTGQPAGRNPILASLMDKHFERLFSDLLEEVPKHLGDAFAAALVAYPSRAADPRSEKAQAAISPGERAEAYALANLDGLTVATLEALRKACARVRRTDAGFDTHLFGSGPIGSILKSRYADDTCARALCEVSSVDDLGNLVGHVEAMLAEMVDLAIAVVCEEVEKAWIAGAGGCLAEEHLQGRLASIWRRSQNLMARLLENQQNGTVTNIVEDLAGLYATDREVATARKSQVGVLAAPSQAVEYLLLFQPHPYRTFWGGVSSASSLNLASLTGFDAVWSNVFWKRLLLALQSTASQKGMPGWGRVKELCELLGDYHQAALDAFTYYVAPNAGFKVDGPFMFNPIYLPGLDTVNVASTFTKAVFGAMNKGGKADPFWENSSNRLISNLLNATRILYGYATFPILARLIGSKEELRRVIGELESRRKQRLLKSADMLEVQNILNWYNGEWETPGADKGETKTNIIATLTVVTNAFLAAGYQIAFAPQRQADISMPGFNWCFKHGKVIGVNLPEEQHGGVTPVVLALLNKSFQKYVQLRDSQRTRNAEVLKPDPRNPRGRLTIKILDDAREAVTQKIQARRDWREALLGWDVQMSGSHAGDEHGKDLLKRLLPSKGGAGEGDRERVSDVIRTLTFRRPVILDVGFAFTLGVTKGRSRLIESWIKANASISARDAFRTGLLIRQMLTCQELPWPKDLWVDGVPLTLAFAESTNANQPHPDVQAAKRFLASADDALRALVSLGHKEGKALVDLGGGEEAFRMSFRDLPLGLVLPKCEFFNISVQKMLSSENASSKAELWDSRLLGQSDNGAGLSLIAKVRDLTREIRTIEDEIAQLPNTERYIVWIVDECHFFLEGEADAKYASVGRSNRVINLIATQGPSSIYSRMEESIADALLINFPNRIILRQADSEEAETCANLLGGKRRQQVVDRNVTQSFDEMHGQGGEGRGSTSGGSVQFTVKEEERYLVEPGILVDLPAFQGVAVSWDGYSPIPPQKVWLKPDFLYTNQSLRNYDPEIGVKRKTDYVKLPPHYKKGEDLYGLPVLRLMELGILVPDRKEKT